VRSVHRCPGFVEQRVSFRKLALYGNALLHQESDVRIIGKRSLPTQDALRLIALDLALSKLAFCQQQPGFQAGDF
jgi:hypothetical protein